MYVLQSYEVTEEETKASINIIHESSEYYGQSLLSSAYSWSEVGNHIIVRRMYFSTGNLEITPFFVTKNVALKLALLKLYHN